MMHLTSRNRGWKEIPHGGEEPFPDPQEFWTRFIQPRVASTQGISRRDSLEVIEHARRNIDEEVAAMRMSISSLLTRRNAFYPAISVLPAEVLAQILHFHMENEPLPAAITHRLGWIRVTHVCRFWRETALQHPSLWSSLTNRLGEEWIDEMLVRAKSAPISYFQSSDTLTPLPRDASATRRIIPHQLYRLRRLSIVNCAKPIASILDSMVDSSAPVLQSLQLTNFEPEYEPILPHRLFASTSPMLRRLESSNVQIPWSSPILHGLHHLRIEFQFTEQITPISYRQFFCALRAMPDLQTLWLENRLPTRPEQLQSECSAELPRLEKLSFSSTDTLVDCADILKRIVIPRSCRVAVHCDCLSADHLEDIADPIRTHTDANAQHPPPLTMYLSTTHGWKSLYTMHLWRSAISPGPVDICDDPDLTLTFRIPVSPNLAHVPESPNLAHIGFKTLIESLWMDSITTLIINDDSNSQRLWETHDLMRTLQHTRLENVSVYGDTAVAFCDALRTPIDDGGPGSSEKDTVLTKSRLFLSGLKFLELRSVYFDSLFPEISSNVFYQDLKDWLSLRAEVSGTYPTLAITTCSISPELVEELRQKTEVRWDHVKRKF